ncbi:hypothetical protein BJ122_102244 [Rhodopseudomonas faecalis]|uniref:Uncharacterized protein n=1 Tax=Rhodopseudomonas faecalis TaxID=99655 RepID=A0A318TPT6_9BRAD|nr:hypothetical protein [Rhodopseudomonas faecalis]PYF05018.1 hypothetical protein BJ122_102244 [Rhodopseudomonas faecalis]
MTISKLSPADLGILAAALDDARSQRLGDDGICDEIARAIIVNDIAHGDAAKKLAYEYVHSYIKARA